MKRLIIEIPIERIRIINKDYKEPRPEMVRGTKRRILEEGIGRPFVVTRINSHYILDNSFTKFTALKQLGYKTIPCKVISYKERERILTEKRRFMRNYR